MFRFFVKIKVAITGFNFRTYETWILTQMNVQSMAYLKKMLDVICAPRTQIISFLVIYLYIFFSFF